MLIDWFTVGAQVLNFVILVWLMKRFLYKPILNAIDAREKRIAGELADADARRAEAEKARKEFQMKKAEFDEQRAALLSQATDEVKAERQRLLDEAGKSAEDLRSKWKEGLRTEEQNLRQAIGGRTRQEVFAITRKTVKDLAGSNLEEQIVGVFLVRLREMKGDERNMLLAAIQTSRSPVAVRTAFELSSPLRARTEVAIKESLGAGTRIEFETAPDLIAGIELVTNGQKIAWSIEDYLTTMEKGIGELLNGEPKFEAGNREPGF